eukprot:1161911-Pelagomonas_calceolata.AAC.11
MVVSAFACSMAVSAGNMALGACACTGKVFSVCAGSACACASIMDACVCKAPSACSSAPSVCLSACACASIMNVCVCKAPSACSSALSVCLSACACPSACAGAHMVTVACKAPSACAGACSMLFSASACACKAPSACAGACSMLYSASACACRASAGAFVGMHIVSSRSLQKQRVLHSFKGLCIVVQKLSTYYEREIHGQRIIPAYAQDIRRMGMLWQDRYMAGGYMHNAHPTSSNFCPRPPP